MVAQRRNAPAGPRLPATRLPLRRAAGFRAPCRTLWPVRPRPLPAWLCAATLLAAAAVASADEAAEKFFRQREARAAKAVAAKLWEAADRARRDSLFAFARAEAIRVVELDPDHAAARAFLGYVRKSDGWSMELGAGARTPTENLDPPGEATLEEAESNWRRRHAAKAAADAASIWSRVGEECAARGYREHAADAFARSLAFDPDDAAARTGLGQVRFGKGGAWIPGVWARALESALVVAPVEAASRFEEILATPLVKGQSAHFRAESALGADALRDALDACERIYVAYLAEMGADPALAILPERPTFCLVADEAQWDRWINRLTHGDPGRWRGRPCHWARDRGACAVRGGPETTAAMRRDRVAHQTVHLLNRAFLGIDDGSWLDDALAFRYVLQVEGTTSSHCLPAKKSEYPGSAARSEWTDPPQWKTLLREAVAAKDDIPLRAIVARTAQDLPLAAGVKAWSVVDFLVRADRAAFAAMARDLKGASDPVAPLETRFGKDVDALDAAWRRWVLETY